jgi:hypothetical protein
MNEIGYLLAFLCGSTVVYAVWSMMQDATRQTREESVAVLPFMALKKTQEQILAENLDNALKFESFVTGKFNKAFFRLLDWRSDKSYHGEFPLSSLYPDLKYEFVPAAIYFAVECKWRRNFYNDGIEISKDQLHRYLKYQQCFDENVFFVIGIGGQPETPDNLYIVPVSEINTHSPFLSREILNNYSRLSAGDFYFDSQLRQLK